MPDFDVPTLVENSPGPPAGPSPGVFAGFEENLRGKMDAQEKVFSQQEGAFAKRTAQMEEAFTASGVEANKLQPWDAKQKEAEFYHNPIEAFGSLGSVFGILASAFTHAPMENALNASAGAMNAIREGDEKSYKNAFEAYKQNMDLVVKRHNMQRDLFNDAYSLLKVDMSAGEAKLKNIAARFGDQQTLTLLENGMSKEVFELQQARDRSVQGMMKTNEMITEQKLRDAVFKADDAANADIKDPMLKAAHRLELFNRVHGVKQTTEQEIMGKWFYEHPAGTAEEAAAFRNQNFGYGARPLTTDAAIIEQLREDHRQAGKPEPTAAEIADAVAKAKRAGGAAGGNTNLTGDRQRAQDVAVYRKELQDAKNDAGTPKYNATQIADMAAAREAELKARASAPSGNRVDELKSRLFRAGEMKSTIDKVADLLKKHKAMTGLGGTLTRPTEVVSNWFGSNETDRAQFQSWINELRELAPRILTDSSGRPLAGDQAKIDRIVRGLNPGDTTANTARSLQEFKELLGRIEGDLQTRMRAAPSGSGGAPKSEPGGTPAWKKYPKVTSIESDEETA